jgi:hypothetical protein
MRRRALLALSSAATLATPRPAVTQAGKPRLAVVDPGEAVTQMSTSGGNRLYRAFFRELYRLGRAEGTNLTVERWSANVEVLAFFRWRETWLRAGPT